MDVKLRDFGVFPLALGATKNPLYGVLLKSDGVKFDWLI